MPSDNANVPEWTNLYHWPGLFKGRAEYLRLMLEDAKVSYTVSGETLSGPTTVAPTGMMDGCFSWNTPSR